MTKIDLVTGILGAGKTTFIKKYARYLMKQGRKIAVLLNDYGAVNIDMALLRDLTCDMCSVSMVVGGADADCHKRRFKTQLINIGMMHYDRVIIEPSGIFDMDEYFDVLYESPLDRWFEKGSIITVADINTESDLSDEMKFMLGSEAACCGTLIASKTGTGTNPESVTALAENINNSLDFIGCSRRFSADDILAVNWDSLTDSDFESIASSGYRNESYIKLFNRDTVTSDVHYFMHVHIPESEAEQLVKQILSDSECGNIYRIKGSLQKESGAWMRINAMPSSVTVSDAEDGQAVIIVIGDNLNPGKIDSHIRRLNSDPEYISI